MFSCCFHPFTISSAPHEKHLTLHIRGVGPWTKKIREVYKPQTSFLRASYYPQIYVDGPFGEGHQSWWAHNVVVFVGGGIGVTPFASILKDLAYKLSKLSVDESIYTKKAIFVWVTRSQKQFEWFTDILREIEGIPNVGDTIRNHVFITELPSKYDLRTIMLYLTERHFHKVSRTIISTMESNEKKIVI